MPVDFGITPDPVLMVARVIGRMIPDDVDMLHVRDLPDGYNAHKDGLAVVVGDDVPQVDGVSHSRDLVRVSVYGPDRDLVLRWGRNLHSALTQGVGGVGLGVSRTRSAFFGVGPSFKPTGFVSTSSLSVGMGRIFRTANQ